MAKIKVYHTCERRAERLTKPTYHDSGKSTTSCWFGSGYYFWESLEDAKSWGENKKNKSNGGYEVYECELFWDEDRLFDTVFNEEHYRTFLQIIDLIVADIRQKHREYQDNKNRPIPNDLFWNYLGKRPKADWTSLYDVLRGDDRPMTLSPVAGMPTRKRIQYAVFAEPLDKNIQNFKLFNHYLPKSKWINYSR